MLGQIIVVSDNRTRIAIGSKVLSGIEAECSGNAKRPDFSTSICCEMGLSAVLDKKQAVFIADGFYFLDACRLAEKVNRD